nr:MAG TPA: hypothetical protein [Caudoviricetes sp.]
MSFFIKSQKRTVRRQHFKRLILNESHYCSL